ncbi:MAG TPA: hypothetical protein VFZ67_10185 [Nitrososphaera sp.]
MQSKVVKVVNDSALQAHCKGDEIFSSARTKYNTTFITAAIVSAIAAIVAFVVTGKPNTRGGRR